MKEKVTTTQSYTIALAVGAILWLGTMVMSGRNEAWDSPLYWSVAYPLAIGVAGVLGYLAPEKPWRWALAVMLIQPVVMVFTASGSASLLPLALVMFAILALPAIGVAKFTARMQGRRRAT